MWKLLSKKTLASQFGMSGVKTRFGHYGGIISKTHKVLSLWLIEMTERVVEARDELHMMLNDDELRDAVLLVFANNQDLLNAMNAAEITDKVGLHSLGQCHCQVHSENLCNIRRRTLRGVGLAIQQHKLLKCPQVPQKLLSMLKRYTNHANWKQM